MGLGLVDFPWAWKVYFQKNVISPSQNMSYHDIWIRHGGSYGQNGAANSTLTRWDSALGNIEDAKVAFDILRRSIEDAVYLDEEAYKQVTPTMQFTKVIQVNPPSPTHPTTPLHSTPLHFWGIPNLGEGGESNGGSSLALL
jgi:hypothetical protein